MGSCIFGVGRVNFVDLDGSINVWMGTLNMWVVIFGWLSISSLVSMGLIRLQIQLNEFLLQLMYFLDK